MNSASSTLNLSSNPCAKSLSIAAGPSLQKDCNALVQQHGGKLGFWSISITNGGNLHCKLVFHAVCEQYDGAGGSEKVSIVCRLVKLAPIILKFYVGTTSGIGLDHSLPNDHLVTFTPDGVA